MMQPFQFFVAGGLAMSRRKAVFTLFEIQNLLYFAKATILTTDLLTTILRDLLSVNYKNFQYLFRNYNTIMLPLLKSLLEDIMKKVEVRINSESFATPVISFPCFERRQRVA